MLIEKLLLHLNKEDLRARKEKNPVIIQENKIEIEGVNESRNDTKTTYLNLDFLKSFTNGKKDKEVKYLNLFLDNAPKLLNQIEEAVKQVDYESLTIAAHSLKSQLNYVGVKEEQSHIYKIEKMAREKNEIAQISKEIELLKKVCLQLFEEVKKALE